MKRHQRTTHRIAGRLHKSCPRCLRILPAEAFTQDRSKDSGLKSWCMECVRGGKKMQTVLGLYVKPKEVLQGVRRLLRKE